MEKSCYNKWKCVATSFTIKVERAQMIFRTFCARFLERGNGKLLKFGILISWGLLANRICSSWVFTVKQKICKFSVSLKSILSFFVSKQISLKKKTIQYFKFKHCWILKNVKSMHLSFSWLNYILVKSCFYEKNELKWQIVS